MGKRALYSTCRAAIALALMGAPPAFAERTSKSASSQNAQTLEAFGADVVPNWGDITAFDGSVNPFWGDISSFWGDISASEGDIHPYWGDISAFQSGATPAWGDISAFWGEIAAFWSDNHEALRELESRWGDISAFEGDAAGLAELFEEIIVEFEAFWGDAARAQTGQSFRDGFVADLFAKHGIDLNDPSTLEGKSSFDRARFMFDLHDGLMSLTGLDQVDWWMSATNWTPAMTQAQGSGADSIIGLIDFTVTPNSDLSDNVISWDGSMDPLDGHGGAVASLLVADHDGRGVMGIAPMASIAAYNPFDETGTAGWKDVRKGVLSVVDAGASVVNMSLGVPGSTFHPDWADIYSDQQVIDAARNVIFVHAAGNEGVAQTENVTLNTWNSPQILIVGSVGPDGQISEFSNTPGSACFVDQGGWCQVPMMNRFLVAPGEWILVSDGEGGVTRRSGTSFAAPLVTGAIALLHDRWPWLAHNPYGTVTLLLESAVDLGEPGVDEVYGHGMLNIGGLQSPLNFDSMIYYAERDGVLYQQNLKSGTSGSGGDRIWNVEGGYFFGFEYGSFGHRDFLIPIDQRLVGSSATVWGRTEKFQDYLYASFVDWAEGNSNLVDDAPLSNPFGWDMRISMSPLSPERQRRDNQLPYKAEMAFGAASGATVRLGHGDGARRLFGVDSFSANSFSPEMGGANPLLGLASGGFYSNVELPVGGARTMSFGFTTGGSEQIQIAPFSHEETPVFETVSPYSAKAAHLSLTQPISARLSVTAGYSFLTETDGLLGVQSLDPNDFAFGARTDAASVGVEYALNDQIEIGATALLGRTRDQAANGTALTVADGGLAMSSFETSVAMRDILANDDRARIALLQPLQLESGDLAYTSYEVIDRSTGEIGPVERVMSINSGRRVIALEGMYARPMMDGAAEVSGFLRLENAADASAVMIEPTIGARFKVGF